MSDAPPTTVVTAYLPAPSPLTEARIIKHWCDDAGCHKWGSFGFDRRYGTECYCVEHRPDGERYPRRASISCLDGGLLFDFFERCVDFMRLRVLQTDDLILSDVGGQKQSPRLEGQDAGNVEPVHYRSGVRIATGVNQLRLGSKRSTEGGDRHRVAPKVAEAEHKGQLTCRASAAAWTTWENLVTALENTAPDPRHASNGLHPATVGAILQTCEATGGTSPDGGGCEPAENPAMADESDKQKLYGPAIERLVAETGISPQQARELIDLLGLDWPSLIREARTLGTDRVRK